MQIKTIQIPIRDLVQNYIDNGDGGVFTYNDDPNSSKRKLVCRPAYQRSFVYTAEEA